MKIPYLDVEVRIKGDRISGFFHPNMPYFYVGCNPCTKPLLTYPIYKDR